MSPSIGKKLGMISRRLLNKQHMQAKSQGRLYAKAKTGCIAGNDVADNMPGVSPATSSMGIGGVVARLPPTPS
jgi:hypothetical protein